jgi:dihydrofolate reductase
VDGLFTRELPGQRPISLFARPLIGGVDGGIYLSGSGTLVRSLIADGLIDELHLFIYPLTRGAGPHLFPDDTPTKWSLARSVTYDNGVLYLVVTPATTT